MYGNLTTVLLLTAVLAPGLRAQESAVTREGGYWVQSVAGSGAISQSRMQVKTNGDVAVSGGSKSGYSYLLKLRVKASTEKQARSRLAVMRVSTVTKGD